METLNIENFLTLGMLVLLQAVLGFDNLLYIALESRNAPPEKQAYVRRLGIGIAIILRIGLLFLLVYLVKYFQEIIFEINWVGVFVGKFSIHGLIVLAGGGFIVYTAMKEVWHMIAMEEHEELEKKTPHSVGKAIAMIVLMNLVFSFDSILSAIALSDVFWVMATAVIIGGLLMMWLADHVTQFLKKNRMYEVLGLFILFLVGVMLMSEGGHLAHIKVLDSPIESMSKATFYFVIVILIVIDVVQGQYKKKLIKIKNRKEDLEAKS